MPTLRKQNRKEVVIPRGKETRPSGRASQRETYTKFNASKIVPEKQTVYEIIRGLIVGLAMYLICLFVGAVEAGVFPF